MTTKVLTAHIPLPLAEKVDQFATRLECSRTWIIKQALSAWIDREEERQRLTIEAMADVDAGRSLTTRRYKSGRKVLAPKPRCHRRNDGTEMDQQGAFRSGAALRFSGAG
jgi:predicted transcriptional regulator